MLRLLKAVPLLHLLVWVMILAIPSVQADSLLVDGNLILVNPLQSSVILIAIVLSSVGLEMVVAALQQLENRYLRITLRLFTEEVMILGLAEVGLLTINFTVSGLHKDTNLEINIVALILVYMALTYGIINSCLAVVLQTRGKEWRTFEWGRLEADAQHDGLQRLFKQGRRWFLILLQRIVSSQNLNIKELPPVAFAVFISRTERRYLRSMFDITFVSWGGLAVMVVLNLCRSLLVGSDSLAWEVHSFILLVGYGTMIMLVLVKFVISRRLNRFFVDALSGDAAHAEVQTSGVATRTASSALLFGSVDYTLHFYKICHLIMLWYMAVYIVVEGRISYDAHGWYSILVILEAAFPVVVMYAQFPSAIFVALMSVALGKHVDEDTVEQLKHGCSLDDASSSDSDMDEEEALEKMAMEERNSRNRHRGAQSGTSSRSIAVARTAAHNRKNVSAREAYEDDDERIPCDDEPEESFGTFHDRAPDDQVPPGEPMMVLGVPPPPNPRRWTTKPLEPVFL